MANYILKSTKQPVYVFAAPVIPPAKDNDSLYLEALRNWHLTYANILIPLGRRTKRGNRGHVCVIRKDKLERLTNGE